MSRRTRLLAVFASTPLVALVTVGGLLGSARPVTGQQGVEHLRVFLDVVRLTVSAYVEPPDIDKVMDGAMRGLTDGLDPMSAYLSPAEVRAVETGTPLPPADVGLTLTRQFWLRVVGVRDESPAARAGIRSGDILRAIDDVPTRDMSVHTATRMLAGDAGTTTTVLVIRSSLIEPHPVVLTRERPPTTRATARRLPGGEAYLRIRSFGPGVVDQIRAGIQTLGAATQAGLIIDIRDTADAQPEDGVAVARLFVKQGTLATKGPRHGEHVTTSATAGDGDIAVPLVLLVSQGTAHAAEVFAAALVDNQRAVLVGTPTAGLAASQTLVKLPENHGLLLTTARYLRADGTPIHEQPLRPEVAVDLPLVPFDSPAPETDVALDRAVEALRAAER